MQQRCDIVTCNHSTQLTVYSPQTHGTHPFPDPPWCEANALFCQPFSCLLQWPRPRPRPRPLCCQWLSVWGGCHTCANSSSVEQLYTTGSSYLVYVVHPKTDVVQCRHMHLSNYTHTRIRIHTHTTVTPCMPRRPTHTHTHNGHAMHATPANALNTLNRRNPARCVPKHVAKCVSVKAGGCPCHNIVVRVRGCGADRGREVVVDQHARVGTADKAQAASRYLWRALRVKWLHQIDLDTPRHRQQVGTFGARSGSSGSIKSISTPQGLVYATPVRAIRTDLMSKCMCKVKMLL